MKPRADIDGVVYLITDAPIAPRGPPARDDAPEPMPDWDLFGQSEPDFEFDQRVAW